MVEEEFVNAREAAALLGVSVTTLYVYVGRKGLRSQAVPGSRERRYWKPDVMRLKRDAGGRVAKPPAGELKRESALTLRTEAGPFYRGRSAIELADTFTLEDVAALLWDCPKEAVFTDDLPRAFDQQEQWLGLLAEKTSVDRALAMFPRLEEADPRAFDLSPRGMARTGADVVRWMAAMALGRAPSVKPVHQQLADALELNEVRTTLLRQFLVISADHGFEPGAYVVRAVASTGVTPWRCVMTGLLVTAGRRSAFSRYDGVSQFLQELLDAPDANAPIYRRLRRGEAIPGFGSDLYGGRDPRARALMDSVASALPDDPDWLRIRAACEVVREALDAEPDFAFAGVVMRHVLGIKGDLPLHLIGRTVGWIAHSIEQYASGAVEHREGRYLGPLPT